MEVNRVLSAIDQLPEEQRAVVLLVGVEELSYNEAAAVLGVPPGTLMSRLHRGRERLREILRMVEQRPAIKQVK
jgi:RNA polymerase sigma-70 factor (ECF subfamily)